MGYTRSVIAGFGWQTGLKFATSALSLAKVAIVARLLSPDDFGLFSITLIALGLTEAFTQTGINTTIVQSKKSTKYFLNTAWIIAIARGIVISLIMLLMGLVLSLIYQNQELKPLIFLAALVPFIKGFINPYIVNWYKTLQYAKESIFYFCLALIETSAAIILSFLLGSAYALILALIIGGIFEVLSSFLLFSEKPKISFSQEVAGKILDNAKGLTLSSALNYINDNLDNLLVGRVLGTFDLGLYHNGYNLGHKLNYELSKGAFHSLMPIFSRVKEDHNRLSRGFSKALVVMGGITFFATIPLIVFPRFVIQLALGPKWLTLSPALPWLAIAGWLNGIASIVYSGLIGTKKYALVNSHLALSIIVLVPTIIYLSQWLGLVGAGLAILVTRLITLPLIIYAAYQLKKSKK